MPVCNWSSRKREWVSVVFFGGEGSLFIRAVKPYFKFNNFLERMTLKTGKTISNDKQPVSPSSPYPPPKKFCVALASFFTLENNVANLLFSLSMNWEECSGFLWFVVCVCVYMGSLDSRWEESYKCPSSLKMNFY